MNPAISIIFPAYDEAERIAPTLRAYDDWLRRSGLTYELVVVDDGSTDGTAEIVAATGLARLLRLPENRGKGHAVRAGMAFARGRWRVFTDGDGSTPPTELPALLEPLMMGRAQVSIGSRYAPGARVEVAQPTHRVLWSRVVNRVVRAALLPGVRDTQCGFKAFTTEAAEAVFPCCTIDGWSFDLELLALARRMGFRIEEVGVRWADDDRSRVRVSHLGRSLRELVRIRRSVGFAPG